MKTSQIGAAVTLTGMLLIVAALVWPSVDSPRNQWTDEDAQTYQETVARAHEGAILQHRSQQGVSMHGGGPIDPERLAQHRTDVEQLQEMKAKVQNARERPHRIATFLKWTGAGLAAVGVVLLLGKRGN